MKKILMLGILVLFVFTGFRVNAEELNTNKFFTDGRKINDVDVHEGATNSLSPRREEVVGAEKEIEIPKAPNELVVPSEPLISNQYNCDTSYMYDYNPYTGFWDDSGFCIPGVVSNEAWFTKSPQYVYGKAVFYAPGVMRATAKYRGTYNIAYGEEYLGGVAVPSPADIGETVWLRRSGGTWEGPYLVVDCSQRGDVYTHVVYNNQVVEVDFDTAVRWGMTYYTGGGWGVYQSSEAPVEVFYGKDQPSEYLRYTQEPTLLSKYWLDRVVTFSKGYEARPIMTQFGELPLWNFLDGSGDVCLLRECN